MRIHLLDSGAVEKELSDNQLDECTRAAYLTLAWIISIAISYSTLIFANVGRSWMGLFEGVSLIAVIAWGFVYTLRSNGGQAGRDFVARFTCLLVPVSIKANLIVWVLFYLLGWGYQAIVPKLSFSSQASADLFVRIAPHLPAIMIYVANVLVLILIFTMIAQHLKRIGRVAHR